MGVNDSLNMRIQEKIYLLLIFKTINRIYLIYFINKQTLPCEHITLPDFCFYLLRNYESISFIIP